MKIEVAKNAKRNFAVGLLNKLILLILPFVNRSVITIYLGGHYLGLSSLFTSIMQVLSLAELGFSSAIVYHMYKPIARDDRKEINALLLFYRKAYRVVGLAVLVIGGCVMPFLPRLIHGSYPEEINIYLLFSVYMLNSSLSYFLFAYKQSLLSAYQREDLHSLIHLAVKLGLQLAQVAVLLLTRNYYYYILCLPLFTLLNNLWIAIVTKKVFPWARPEGDPGGETLQSIKKLVAGSFIQRACSVTRNSLDSICISAFLGLLLTGIYNNYYAVLQGVIQLLQLVSVSLSAGIGHHVAIKSSEENFEELKRLDFLYMTVSGICTTCMLCLYQPFMVLWMGEDMLLPFPAVLLFCSYFYMLTVGDMKYLYNNANGLWWKMRWRALAETLLNVTLNVVLGKLFGVYGIVAATIISLLLCNFLWGSTLLFREYFGMQCLREYFLYHLQYLLVSALSCAACYYLSGAIHMANPYAELLSKGIVTAVTAATLHLLVYGRSEIFRQSLKMLRLRK